MTLLTQAAKDVIADPKNLQKLNHFYGLFFAGDVFTLQIDNQLSKDMELKATSPRLKFPIFEGNDEAYLLVFDTLESLERTVGQYKLSVNAYARVVGHAFVEMALQTKITMIVFNYGANSMRAIDRQTLEQLQKRYHAKEPVNFTVEKGEQLVIAAPDEMPAGFLEALKNVIHANTENNRIVSAYLAKMNIAGNSSFVMLLAFKSSPSPELTNLAQEVQTVASHFFKERIAFDLAIDNDNDFCRSVKEIVKPFYCI